METYDDFIKKNLKVEESWEIKNLKEIEERKRKRKYFPEWDSLNEFVWVFTIIIIFIAFYLIGINPILSLIIAMIVAIIVYNKLPTRGCLQDGSIVRSIILAHIIVFITIVMLFFSFVFLIAFLLTAR